MGETGPLEKALEEIIGRGLDSRLAMFLGQIQRAVHEAVGNAVGQGAAGAVPAAAAARVTGIPPTPGSSALTTASQGVSRVLQPTAQAEILGALLQAAAQFTGRCSLYIRRGDAFTLWRGEGFPAETFVRLRTVSISASQPGMFKEVCESQLAVSSRCSEDSLPGELIQALGNLAEESIYLLPIVVQGKVVAALYADSGPSAGSVESAGLEILARVAGLSLETAATRQAVRAAASAGVPHEAARTVQEPVAEVAAAEAPAPEAAPPATVELESPVMVASEAAEGPEVGTAAPPPGSFAASIPSAAELPPALPPPPEPDSLAEEDREVHRKAHRFARVAVQDLLSYHRNKIQEGRQNRNLYALLREDIEKTRENYQKRFGQTAARSFDYFHYELVLKLAGNDLEALGSEYPGPVE